MEKPYLFFAMAQDEEQGDDTAVMIVSQEYWEENHAIESVHLIDTLADNLPTCIYDELAESMFLSDLDRDQTKERMEAAGFIWEPALATAGQTQ